MKSRRQFSLRVRYAEETGAMNIGDTFSESKSSATKISDGTDDLTNGYASPSNQRSTGRKDSEVKDYSTRTATNLRSIVEHRFMRMSRAHDRIRTELLGSHSS